MQAVLGAKMPYKEAEETLEKFSCQRRRVNNHVKIAEATNTVGSILNKVKLEEEVDISGDTEHY